MSRVETVKSIADLKSSFLPLCWADSGSSSEYLRRADWAVLKEDPERLRGVILKERLCPELTWAQFEPEWTAFWWRRVFATRLGHILYLNNRMLFSFLKHSLWWCRVHRCVDREFILNGQPLYSWWIKVKPECVHLIPIYLHFLFCTKFCLILRMWIWVNYWTTTKRPNLLHWIRPLGLVYLFLLDSLFIRDWSSEFASWHGEDPHSSTVDTFLFSRENNHQPTYKAQMNPNLKTAWAYLTSVKLAKWVSQSKCFIYRFFVQSQ